MTLKMNLIFLVLSRNGSTLAAVFYTSKHPVQYYRTVT